VTARIEVASTGEEVVAFYALDHVWTDARARGEFVDGERERGPAVRHQPADDNGCAGRLVRSDLLVYWGEILGRRLVHRANGRWTPGAVFDDQGDVARSGSAQLGIFREVEHGPGIGPR
jgi:hypothetical protein